MRVPAQFLLVRHNQRRLVRVAISAGAVALVYWMGRLSGRNMLSFGHAWAWLTVCYTVIGMYFLIYGASNVAIRWTIIPIGAAFGYIAGRVSQPIIDMMFEPRRMFWHVYPSPWEAIFSIFFLTPWLAGAIVGAIVLAAYRVLVASDARWHASDRV